MAKNLISQYIARKSGRGLFDLIPTAAFAGIAGRVLSQDGARLAASIAFGEMDRPVTVEMVKSETGGIALPVYHGVPAAALADPRVGFRFAKSGADMALRIGFRAKARKESKYVSTLRTLKAGLKV